MSFIEWFGLIIAACLGVTVALFRRGGLYNPIVPSTDNSITEIPLEPPLEASKLPSDESKPPTPTLPAYEWETPEKARHSVRVICDEMGLSFKEKNLICAVIEGESEFYNSAVNKNRNKFGKVTSTDWGLCQINDRYHIGPGKTFESVDFVLQHPDQIVRWMIQMYKQGHLDWWIAYANGSYKKYLV